MSTPYQSLSADARTEILRRKSFLQGKLKECEEFLRLVEALPTFLASDVSLSRGAPRAEADTDRADVADASADDLLPPLRPRKEDRYDREVVTLLTQVKVASKMAVFQHLHRAFNGDVSIGAIDSYLKRAVLRGTIVRLRRGEYALPPKTD